MIAWSSTDLFVMLLLVYLIGGVWVGALLARRGHDGAAAVSAVVAWPLLLPLIREDPGPEGGPHATRIHHVFASLLSTLDDPAAGSVPWADDLDTLRRALLDADERLGLVDRLLADTVDASVARGALEEARRRTASEIESVLEEVVQLRLQIGLLALEGDTAALRDRVRELMHRARALDEVTRIAHVG